MIDALLNILLTLIIAIFIVICVAVLITVFLFAIAMIGSVCRKLREGDKNDKDKPGAGA